MAEQEDQAPEPHVVPPVWADAYNAALERVDRGEADVTVELPAVILPVGLVRQILKVFDPDGEF